MFAILGNVHKLGSVTEGRTLEKQEQISRRNDSHNVKVFQS